MFVISKFSKFHFVFQFQFRNQIFLQRCKRELDIIYAIKPMPSIHSTGQLSRKRDLFRNAPGTKSLVISNTSYGRSKIVFTRESYGELDCFSRTLDRFSTLRLSGNLDSFFTSNTVSHNFDLILLKCFISRKSNFTLVTFGASRPFTENRTTKKFSRLGIRMKSCLLCNNVFPEIAISIFSVFFFNYYPTG